MDYVCDPSLPADIIMEVSEAPTCVYSIRVHTPRICPCTEEKMQCGEPALRELPALYAY